MKNYLLLILLSIFLWGLWGFLAKLASQKIGIQATFWNAIAFSAVVIAFLFLASQLLPIKKDFNGILLAVLAGASSAIASVVFYFLLGKKPAGFLVAITALYPLVTIILSVIFLKESLGITKILGFIFAILALFLLQL